MRLRDLKRELRYQEETPAEKYWEDNPGREGLGKLLDIQDKLKKTVMEAPSKKVIVEKLEDHTYELMERYFQEIFGDSLGEWSEDSIFEYLKDKSDEDPEFKALNRLFAKKVHPTYKTLLEADISKILLI